MRKFCNTLDCDLGRCGLTRNRGCEPLTGDDIAEIIVFAAGRRENVVLADSLIFPNHQASATIMHRKSA